MRKKPHPEHVIWISGYNPAKEALRSPGMRIKEVVLARKDQRAVELRIMAEERGINVRHDAFDALSALVGHIHHQGVAVCSPEFRYTLLEDLQRLPLEEREPLLLPDCVQDPQNLGALIRSACFLGAKGMIIPKDRSARISSTVVKIASGATVYLPVIQVSNLAQALEKLKKNGLWIVGLDVEGEQSLFDTDLCVPLGLVVGNEQKGIRPLIRKHCDFLVRIPAGGPLHSLNAATAGAIALAEVQRQRLAVRK